MPDKSAVPERIWAAEDRSNYGPCRTWSDRPMKDWDNCAQYLRADLIPDMLQEARNEAFREAARAAGAVAAPVTGTPYSVGGRLFSQAILALIDTPAPPTPAEPSGACGKTAPQPAPADREAVKRLVTVARRQVESMCEGFCKNFPSAGLFTEDMEHDCAVCRLRAALAAAPQPAPAEPAGDALREATRAMVDAAFKALPADADGTIGTGEMYRVLDAALAAAPLPSTTGERLIRAAEEATAIARGEAKPARVYRAPQPAPVSIACALWAEYLRVDEWASSLHTIEEAHAARIAIRCCATRLGVYPEFVALDKEGEYFSPPPIPADREALVEVIAEARGRFTPNEMAWAGDGYHDEERAIADALLADGWRKAATGNKGAEKC